MAKQSKKTNPGQVIIDESPDRLRLIELEERIRAMFARGTLWDPEDPNVVEILKERDRLWNKLEPQNPIECRDIKEEDWEQIDKEVEEETKKEPYDPKRNF